MKAIVSSKGQIVLPAVHGLAVATRNRADFEKSGVKVVAPWKT